MVCELNLNLGLDIGNGYVKGRYSSKDKIESIDMPSCAAYLSSILNVSGTDNTFTVNAKNIPSDFFNQMVCTIDSPLIPETNRSRFVVFGTNAISTGRSLQQFDIGDRGLSKADQTLSYLLLFASVAGASVINYLTANAVDDMPNKLKVNTKVSLNLPLDEFASKKDIFVNSLNGSHKVTIHNFSKPVAIDITFANVNILPEGLAAQYAIMTKGEPLVKALLDDACKRNKELSIFTPKDILSCSRVCGIDIGEGTVNIPVIINRQFSQLSRVIHSGYGTILESALPAIQEQRLQFDSRKEVADFLQQSPTKFTQNRYKIVKRIVDAESVDLVDRILREISALRNQIDLIYVYGGGATPLQDVLYSRLVERTKSADVFPILYLDSKYARFLNREGLYQSTMTMKKNPSLSKQ